MPILDQTNSEAKAKYEEFIRSHKDRSIMQDPAWAIVKDDWGSEYVYLENDQGDIYAAISILIRTIPLGRSMFYAPRGPICDVYDTEVLKELMEEVRPLAKQYKAFVLRMDPEIPYSDELNNQLNSNGFVVKNRDVDFNDLIQPRNNMIIYLEDMDAADLMSTFKSGTRNKVRKPKKKGVEFTWGRSDEYIEKFFDVYTFMAERNEITHREKDYFYKLRDAYGDQLRVYLAYHEDDLLAGAITVNYYGKVYYLYGGSNNTKRNKYPNQGMQYEMIVWGIEENADQYDFGGVIDMSEDDGLYRFKKQFTEKDGVTEYIGEIDFVYNNFFYNAFEKLVPVVRKARKKLQRD